MSEGDLDLAGEYDDIRKLIDAAYDDRALLDDDLYADAVHETIRLMDEGELRYADKSTGEWRTHPWLQKAIWCYFAVTKMEVTKAGVFESYDRLPLKQGHARRGIRSVPGAIARYGSHIEPGVVLMPSFVNIGAYVASGTLVDTWATVGSGAQIGKNVHLAGGVGIGGVLEPIGATPVIVEDDAFVGSRCVIVEGVVVEERAILGAQVSLTANSHIIDVTGSEPVTYKGRVPAGAVVIPGTRSREFNAGTFQVGCALIIGYRSDQQDAKLKLADEARDFGIEL
jgi:2,3,4,5-tetrahydropyridine-2,6-dicarboxylate N-succinyltransferase